MIMTDYPYDGFEDQYPATKNTPSWYGFGHKHYVFPNTPVKHLVLVDGQHHSEIDVQDPDEPLDHVVADRMRGTPAERPHIPVEPLLTLIPTIRPGARLGMEYGQFQHPDTRPAVLANRKLPRAR